MQGLPTFRRDRIETLGQLGDNLVDRHLTTATASSNRVVRLLVNLF